MILEREHESQHVIYFALQGALWGFYQGEPDVWIVVALDTQVSAIEQGGSTYYYKHSPNGEGLVQAIEVHLYDTLVYSRS